MTTTTMPTELRTAEDVARYLEQDFEALLWMVADLIEAGAYCPWALLHDLASVPGDLARVLRGEGSVEFRHHFTGYVDDLTRALTELISRLSNSNEFETPDGVSGLCDRTLSTLAKLIRESQQQTPPAGVS